MQGAERRVKSEESKGSERDVRKLLEVRDAEERKRLRIEILKRAKRLLKGTSVELEEEHGEIELEIESDAARVPAKTAEGFDLEALMGDPEFRTETRPVVENGEYVTTERVHDRAAVRQDGHGRYPEKEDLRAALAHDLFLAMRWVAEHGISPEEAALIAHHHHRKPKEWLWRATEALLAADAELEPDEAVRRVSRVINDLIGMHRTRQERL